MSPLVTNQNQETAREIRILTPMEAILDSSFGTLICPTCDGLFTQESYLESHYLSEDNDCIKLIPSLYERVCNYILIYYESGISSMKDMIKASIDPNQSSQSSDGDMKYDDKMLYAKNSLFKAQDNTSPPIIKRFMSLTWIFIVLILFIYVLCNSSSLVSRMINGDSKVNCME